MINESPFGASKLTIDDGATSSQLLVLTQNVPANPSFNGFGKCLGEKRVHMRFGAQ